MFTPAVFDRLMECARKEKIEVQIEADPRPTGTDARSIQIARKGVPTGLIGIPLRYMHTPSEVIDLGDLENVVKLMVSFGGVSSGEFGLSLTNNNQVQSDILSRFSHLNGNQGGNCRRWRCCWFFLCNLCCRAQPMHKGYPAGSW